MALEKTLQTFVMFVEVVAIYFVNNQTCITLSQFNSNAGSVMEMEEGLQTIVQDAVEEVSWWWQHLLDSVVSAMDLDAVLHKIAELVVAVDGQWKWCESAEVYI